jgi:hypothetical protein
VRRRVVDLRTGREVALAELFGAAAAAHVESAAAAPSTRPWPRCSPPPAARCAMPGATRATPTRATPTAPANATAPRRALTALRTLAFDARNFGLAARAGRPAGDLRRPRPRRRRGRRHAGPAAGGRPGRGAGVVAARRGAALFVGPGADAGAGTARWRDASGAVEVRARVADGAAVLELAPGAGPGAPPAATGTPAARRVLPLARVPAPLQQVVRVDAGAVAPAARRALRRAFDESAFYDAATTSVAWTPGGARRPAAPRAPPGAAPAPAAPSAGA